MRMNLRPRRACAVLLLLLSGCGSSRDEAANSTPVAFDPSFLDTTADPCTDFYQFACGTWLAQHPAQPGFLAERFADGDYRDDIYFSQLVEAMASSDPRLQSAQSYYANCLNADHSPTAVPGALAQQLSLVTAMTGPADLPGVLAALQHSGVHALMAAFPEIDPGNPSQYVVDIGDDGWSLPAAQAYAAPDLSVAYRAHITALALAGQRHARRAGGVRLRAADRRRQWPGR
jgi:putative endopeptidase